MFPYVIRRLNIDLGVQIYAFQFVKIYIGIRNTALGFLIDFYGTCNISFHVRMLRVVRTLSRELILSFSFSPQ